MRHYRETSRVFKQKAMLWAGARIRFRGLINRLKTGIASLMFACIDLGSNSFHLLVARWHNGRHEIVERFSEKVQLGEGLATSGHINSAAFARGLACLDAFALALKRYPISHQWAVGTNALRVADNAGDFIAKAQSRGFCVDVVTGGCQASCRLNA
jgi:exopolyphosphatase/pppGpp-phosphohydrolase